VICTQVKELVDELVDGQLDHERERALRGHLRGCADCAALVAQTEKLVAAAASLEKLDPPSSVWAGVAARLDADDRAAEARPGWWWRWRASRAAWLGFAGATAAALAVAAFALVPPREALRFSVPELRAQRWADAASRLDQAEADYAEALDQLAAIVEEDRARWTAEFRAEFERNRTAVDAVLSQKRDLARRNPDDLEAEAALLMAYRRKVELLQDAALREGL